MKNHEHKDHPEHMRILQKTLGNLYIRNSASENKSAGNWENFVNVSHQPQNGTDLPNFTDGKNS